MLTAVIDYRGFRLQAQGIIPGVFQRDDGASNVAYGSIDNGKTLKVCRGLAVWLMERGVWVCVGVGVWGCVVVGHCYPVQCHLVRPMSDDPCPPHCFPFVQWSEEFHAQLGEIAARINVAERSAVAEDGTAHPLYAGVDTKVLASAAVSERRCDTYFVGLPVLFLCV